MPNQTEIQLDPVHATLDPYSLPGARYIWDMKYRQPGEKSPAESLRRVVDGVHGQSESVVAERAYNYMLQGLFIPAGRIHAGSGTKNKVTLLNCYVMNTIHDSMEGIASVLRESMLTMQQGGGIGLNFSTLRPSGALLERTGSDASGPLPFMDMWDSMCATIMSAGSRRGAMMAVMNCDHPDLVKFIEAKHAPGRLTNFNISVAVTDAFMAAVQEDADWHLGFGKPRSDGEHAEIELDGKPWYIYATHKAKDLWSMILKSTYEYAEPGVIFIDRMNDQNNLQYCETLDTTNPCAEQCLPPYGACNLGAVNLARMIKHPFTPEAEIDIMLLRRTVEVAVEFLDKVLDVSNYPLPEQKEEALQKRRIGLGITGLGSALAMMGLRYGSTESIQFTARVMQCLKEVAYTTSSSLAASIDSFPALEADYWRTPNLVGFELKLREWFNAGGMRNGTLTTIAPTGTTSLYVGCVSGGLEPIFALTTERKVLQPNGEHETLVIDDYALVVHEELFGPEQPLEVATTEDLDVSDHLRIQAVCQKYVDASISKTINCPEDMDFEDFELVYYDAYNTGCKGCTTYRPSGVRGSVLGVHGQERSESDSDEVEIKGQLVARPKRLSGNTYKVKWPSVEASFYVTMNDLDGKPHEIFISSTSAKYTDWTTALTLMISAIMRKGGDISFIPDELMKVISASDTAWIEGRFYGSLVALIGHVIGEHFKYLQGDANVESIKESKEDTIEGIKGEICPSCGMPTLFSREGCMSCASCSYSNCG